MRDSNIHESILLGTYYRNPLLIMGMMILPFAVFTFGLMAAHSFWPGNTGEGLAFAASLLVGGVLYWVYHRALITGRFFDRERGVVYAYVSLSGVAAHYHFLTTFHQIAAVFVESKRDLLTEGCPWKYSISVITHSGRQIQAWSPRHCYEGAVEDGQQLANFIGCPLLVSEPETRMQVRRYGSELEVVPKDEDLGLLGVAVAVACFAGLVQLLWYLAP